MRHNLTFTKGEQHPFTCQECGRFWQRNPSSACPGIRWYSWQSAPGYLQTYTQLRAKHLKPADRAAPDGVLLMHDDWLYLYDERLAKPRRQCSERQRQVLEAARKHQLEKWKCQSCGLEPDSLSDYCHHFRGSHCEGCREQAKAEHEKWKHEVMLRDDGNEAIMWARGILARNDWCILDTETTALTAGLVIDLAIVTPDGETLFNSLINPEHEVTTGARSVHGISDEDLAAAPRLLDVWPQILEALAGHTLILTYNADFDEAVMARSASRYQLPALPQKWECIMEHYARYFGEWSSYWGDYKWQPLNGGHRALGDAIAALDRLRGMAQTELADADDA